MNQIIKLIPTKLIAVVVPEDKKYFDVDYHLTCSHLEYEVEPHKGVPCKRSVFLGRGKFEMLGTVTNLKIDFDYRNETELGTTSFYELLSSHGIMFFNPYPKPNPLEYRDSIYYEGDLKIWQTAQDSIIKKLLILK